MGAVIRDAVDAYTLPRARPRHEALRSLTSLGAPVADWDVMKAEIERGAAMGFWVAGLVVLLVLFRVHMSDVLNIAL